MRRLNAEMKAQNDEKKIILNLEKQVEYLSQELAKFGINVNVQKRKMMDVEESSLQMFSNHQIV